MRDVYETYLGWQQFAHREGCRKPAVEVDWRVDERSLYRGEGERHACPNEDCDHGGTYGRMEVRIVCRACGVVQALVGAQHSSGGGTTQVLGYGETPRKVGTLWAYPGPRLFFDSASEPYGYLLTRERVERVSEGDVVGSISLGRGKRGGAVWSAAAHPVFTASTGGSATPLVRYLSTTEDTFKSMLAASRWVQIQLDAGVPAEGRGVAS